MDVNIYKKLRESRGYSVRGLAKEIDVSYSYISKIENGLMPSLTVCEKYSKFFNTSLSELFLQPGNEPLLLKVHGLSCSEETDAKKVYDTLSYLLDTDACFSLLNCIQNFMERRVDPDIFLLQLETLRCLYEQKMDYTHSELQVILSQPARMQIILKK